MYCLEMVQVIDLVLQNLPSGNWKANNVVQYTEYENSCKVSGRKKVSSNENPLIHIIVNPNNPTGAFLRWSEMESYIMNEVTIEAT